MASSGDSRPSMRRKSSASNLLMQSFKAGTTPTGVSNSLGGPPPISIPTSSVLYTAKDSDTLSTFSDSASINPGQNNLEYLQNEVVRKRLVSLTYLRNVHEGKAHWIGTVHVSRAELERAFPNQSASIKKRTTRFTVLAMALSTAIECTSAVDLLRATSSILSEYEQLQDDNYKPSRLRIPGLRSSARSAGDGVLALPAAPFALDYHQVLLSLIDVLSELYYRLGNLLTQYALAQQQQTPVAHTMSPPPSTAWPLPGPPLAPQHGVEYLRRPGASTEEEEILRLAESAGGGARGGLFELGSPTGGASATWNAALGELVLKVDSKFKKILGTLFKEVDDLARQGIRDELASLDPLLRNVAMTSGAEDPYEVYEI